MADTETNEKRQSAAIPRDVRMLIHSHRALKFGYWSLIPFLGIAFGPLAFDAYIRSRLERAMGHNPGWLHALVGGILGVIGFLASVGWVAVTFF